MITPLYAAILTLILVFLIIRVIKLRRKHGVGLGDGGHYELTQAIRSHGNFVETVPFGLFLMLLLDLQNGMPIVIHALGILLVIGRCLHIMALDQKSLPLRIAGMSSTIAVLTSAAIYNLFLSL